MKVIYNKILPLGKTYYAINLFGILFAKGPVDRYILNHEKIHTAQMMELMVVFFYLWYVLEWLVRLVQYRNGRRAYCNISFEREAYANGDNLGYLKRRERFSFMRYLKKFN